MSEIVSTKKNTRINGNGTYCIEPTDLDSFQGITVRWKSPGIAPAGVLTCHVDGDYGDTPGEINLGEGKRAMPLKLPLWFIHVDVTGFPAGAEAIIGVR